VGHDANPGKRGRAGTGSGAGCSCTDAGRRWAQDPGGGWLRATRWQGSVTRTVEAGSNVAHTPHGAVMRGPSWTEAGWRSARAHPALRWTAPRARVPRGTGLGGGARTVIGAVPPAGGRLATRGNANSWLVSRPAQRPPPSAPAQGNGWGSDSTTNDHEMSNARRQGRGPAWSNLAGGRFAPKSSWRVDT